MNHRIGLIAGSGQFPLLFTKAAREKGYEVFAAAYKHEADPKLKDLVTALEWMYLGQLKKLIRFFKSHDVDQAVMMGAITKTRMFTNVRPDTKAIALLARLDHTHDDAVLRAFANTLEQEGITIRPATFLLPELLAPEGCWTRRKPNRAEMADIRLGWKLAKEIGRLDIGQCIVVGGGSVLAVEAIDGSDATITRGGQLGNGQAIAVKICKPIQDTRFDNPAVGTRTIETMHTAGVRGIAIEAEKAVVFDRQQMVAMADRHGMFIIALKDEL